MPPNEPMPVSPKRTSHVSIASLLVLAVSWLRELGLLHPTVEQVLDATGASRSRAYELLPRLEASLEQLARSPGRPKRQAREPAPPNLTTELLQYVYTHPGCVGGGDARRRYSRGLRLFVLEQIETHKDVPLESIAESTAIPLGTLKDWLRGEQTAVSTEVDDEMGEPTAPDPRGPQIETILAEWERWDGGFSAFCDHVQLHCRVPFGRTLIGRILEANGLRHRQRRSGRSPDELALRGAFETFFPHAQWIGDGTALGVAVAIPVEVQGELHVFNLELAVDAYSGAFVGAHISAVEDSQAVIQAFQDAIDATGERPLALLLDNKPSNHTGDVLGAAGDTLVIPATPYRAQNKAHCEGGFGLLKPTLEGLVLRGSAKAELAASYLRNLVTAVCRAINHRPRADRGGRSRVELLGDTPSAEEVDQARQALADRLRRQTKARETKAARQDPVVRDTLADAYERLGLDDPTGNILTATARYPLEAVVEAVALFEGRRRAQTLPDTADARYLLGIAKNIATERESWEIAVALWDARVAARDAVALHLDRRRRDLDARLHEPFDLIRACVDRAVESCGRLDRFFWLTAAADVIAAQPKASHENLFRLAARRIAATYALASRHRTAAIRFLAAKLHPLS
jgi:hypothetical protein